VAPPTPPIGLAQPSAAAAGAPATSPLAATALVPNAGPTPMAHAPPAQATPRPQAPDFKFSPRAEAPAQDNTMSCPMCGSANQRGLRFCVTCGHLIAPPAAAPAPAHDLLLTVIDPPRDPPAQAPAPPPAPPMAPIAPIAPARVVDLGAGAPRPAAPRVCPRCRGTSEPNAQFCKFCGAPLGEPSPQPVAAPQPAPNPIAAAPVVNRPVTAPLDPPPAAPPMRAPAPPPAPPAPPALSPAQAPTAAPPPPAIHAPPGRTRLVLIARDGGEGPAFPVSDVTDIGRSEGHVLIADDRYVSPRHARITKKGGTYVIRDLGSINGIFLRIPFTLGTHAPRAPRPAPESEQVLEDQDLFLVGQQVLRFEVVKDAEEGYGAASQHGTLLFGTPAAPRYARLSQRTVEGVTRDVFYIRKAETILGRESGDIVFTEDPFLSRRHAAVRVNAPGPSSKDGTKRFALVDLGSSNGTFLQLREEISLRDGDQFRIGQQLFRFDDGA
jgi:pSer/pThr/pTyr-binding forkhead associated (FHA) protein